MRQKRRCITHTNNKRSAFTLSLFYDIVNQGKIPSIHPEEQKTLLRTAGGSEKQDRNPDKKAPTSVRSAASTGLAEESETFT